MNCVHERQKAKRRKPEDREKSYEQDPDKGQKDKAHWGTELSGGGWTWKL